MSQSCVCFTAFKSRLQRFEVIQEPVFPRCLVAGLCLGAGGEQGARPGAPCAPLGPRPGAPAVAAARRVAVPCLGHGPLHRQQLRALLFMRVSGLEHHAMP